MKNTFKLVKDLESRINLLISSNEGQLLVSYYVNRFNLPEHIVNQYLKQRIASNFNTRSEDFHDVMTLPYLFSSILKYIGFLFLAFFYSKKTKIESTSEIYDLLIDDIQHHNELERWRRLENEFGMGKVLFIARSKIDKAIKANDIVTRTALKDYDRSLLLNNTSNILIKDLWFFFQKSFKLNLNLVHLHTYFINDFLYYSSLFKLFKAKYMIQDRNLGRTNALKNYLFKLSGGKVTSCIQKNIAQHNGYALFYDIDIFFSYGDKTADDILDLGARIDHIFPIGSFAMDGSSIDLNHRENRSSSKRQSIDIMYIGINAITSDKTNWDGYYESIKWLATFSTKHNDKKIFIKHHPSWLPDEREFNIIKDTNIEYIEKTADSYEIASQSRLIITYGSSMGYELIGFGLDVIFVDPNNDNPFVNNFLYSSDNVIYRYDNFESILKNSETQGLRKSESQSMDYCHSSDDISRRIHKCLISYKA